MELLNVPTRKYDKLRRRRKELEDKQQYLLKHWKDLRDFVNPLRGRIEQGNTFTQSTPDFSKIVCGKVFQARNTLASGMQSGLTSPSRDWFKLSTSDPATASREVRIWLDTVHDRMLQVMAASNYYEEMHAAYEELATYGNAAMMIEFDFDNIIHCKTFTVGTYYSALDNKDMINTFYLDRWLTAENIIEMFDESKVPEEVKEMNKTRPDERFLVHVAIEPDSKSVRKRYTSSWFMKEGGGTVLRESHFDSFPVMFARWNTIPDIVYGYGPATDALCDVIQLHRMHRDRAMGLAKQVSPPLLAHSSLRGQIVFAGPNAVTYGGDEAGSMDKAVVPLYQVPLNLQELSVAIADMERAVDSGFYKDLFLLLHSQELREMTAAEVAERRTEKMMVLGPVLERLESELLTPGIMRIFSIMINNGLIPEPPEDLLNGTDKIKIEYVSSLAQAQKMAGIPPIQQFMGFLGQLAESFPEAADAVDIDRVVERYHNLVGVPADILKPANIVAQIREQRAQAQQAEAQAAQMAQSANAAKQVAQGAELLSGTNVMGNNALDSILGLNYGSGLGGA